MSAKGLFPSNIPSVPELWEQVNMWTIDFGLCFESIGTKQIIFAHIFFFPLKTQTRPNEQSKSGYISNGLISRSLRLRLASRKHGQSSSTLVVRLMTDAIVSELLLFPSLPAWRLNFKGEPSLRTTPLSPRKLRPLSTDPPSYWHALDMSPAIVSEEIQRLHAESIETPKHNSVVRITEGHESAT